MREETMPTLTELEQPLRELREEINDLWRRL
jgi:hypothetical protein